MFNRGLLLTILLLLLSDLLSPVNAVSSTCTAVSSVSKCVSSIKKKFPKTKSASSFCSSVLKCTITSTVTLKGTVTITKSTTSTETDPFTDFAAATTTTFTYYETETDTTSIPTATSITTFTIEQFKVTTIQPRRRWEFLAPRAIKSCCPAGVQSRACSCIIRPQACPTITKDKRKTVTETSTEYTATLSRTTEYYTETFYSGITSSTTGTGYYVATKGVYVTNTRTVTCTPSVANQSFYLYATNIPQVPNSNARFLQARQDDIPRYFPDYNERKWIYVQSKAQGSLFSIDSNGYLGTPSSRDGAIYLETDYFGAFELAYMAPKAIIDAYLFTYAQCKLLPPSGRFVGSYKELSCVATSKNFDTLVDLTLFQYCPEYDEFYHNPIVIANYTSPEGPTCYNVTFLAVPACGTKIAGF